MPVLGLVWLVPIAQVGAIQEELLPLDARENAVDQPRSLPETFDELRRGIEEAEWEINPEAAQACLDAELREKSKSWFVSRVRRRLRDARAFRSDQGWVLSEDGEITLIEDVLEWYLDNFPDNDPGLHPGELEAALKTD